MPLLTIEIPTPEQLRSGWAAFSAVCSARGWSDSAYADEDQWYYHDGGGNWACLRFLDNKRAVLVGHDHEYSETYFGKAAEYFQEEETDLLLDAPEWWSTRIEPEPFGEWVGFIYGWDGTDWKRAAYENQDGFNSVGLVRTCTEIHGIFEHAKDAPGLNGNDPNPESLRILMNAGPGITVEMLEEAIPGWDIEAGVAAAKRFAEAAV